MKNIFLNDYGLTFIGFISVFIIVAISVISLANFDSSVSCSKKAEMMKLQSIYSFHTGCMVKIDNQWQPFNRYNTINLTNKK